MATPALAYPASVFSNDIPLDVIEYTNMSLVPVVTGIDSPLSVPYAISPIVITPPKSGVSCTKVPLIGVKLLFGAVD